MEDPLLAVLAHHNRGESAAKTKEFSIKISTRGNEDDENGVIISGF